MKRKIILWGLLITLSLGWLNGCMALMGTLADHHSIGTSYRSDHHDGSNRSSHGCGDFEAHNSQYHDDYSN